MRKTNPPNPAEDELNPVSSTEATGTKASIDKPEDIWYNMPKAVGKCWRLKA
ncbi:MAG: hypothetical protein FWB74_00015 [Defluviitaleaceae bacterium]|nr:hypothetical protein [Defluviitaleaceae bacterium]